VVAKAPRKNIAAGRSSVLLPSGGGGTGKRKSKGGGCGHSLKVWPVPKGQRGLQCFLSESSGSEVAVSSSDGAGPSGVVDSEEWDKVETVSSQEDQRPEEEQEEEGSVESSSVPILDDDIAQLNSDDSDED